MHKQNPDMLLFVEKKIIENNALMFQKWSIFFRKLLNDFWKLRKNKLETRSNIKLKRNIENTFQKRSYRKKFKRNLKLKTFCREIFKANNE